LLILLSLCFDSCYALTILSPDFLSGRSLFWAFPAGTVGGSGNDMATNFVGYLYFVRAPWSFPLLHVANLGVPAGTNVFWLDVIPWVALTGKVIYSLTGVVANLLAVHLFLCFVLPGAAMTLFIAATGHRSLVGALAASALTSATPYLLFRWGHPALSSQYLLILALALYVASQRHPRNLWIVGAWLALVGITLLTQIYLFVMVGACWSAALLQRRLNRGITGRQLIFEASAAFGLAVLLLGVIGAWRVDNAWRGVGFLGDYSMNLASPFVPQLSGIFPALADYRVGKEPQYEGFAYLGLGVLALACLNGRYLSRWMWERWRAHVALLLVFMGFIVFAVSNRVYLGNYLLLNIPIPELLSHGLAALRSSGRFFWPVGYAIIGFSIVGVLRHFRPILALPLLFAAAVVQLIDTEPLRAAVVTSAAAPRLAALDRIEARALVASASGVRVYPSFSCVPKGKPTAASPSPETLRQMNMEFQLLAAHANLPTNTVYSARPSADCPAEIAASRLRLEPGILYVYLTGYRPDAAQLNGRKPDEVCGASASIIYCQLGPDAAGEKPQ
jgi:hypothetical protein